MVHHAYARTKARTSGKLSIRWDGQRWVLRRGRWRMADSRDWHEMHELMLRIHDRERTAAQREAFIHGDGGTDARQSVAR